MAIFDDLFGEAILLGGTNPPAIINALLKEDAFDLLLQSGDRIILE